MPEIVVLLYLPSVRLLIKCDLFGWLENEVYSGSLVKESDVPIQLTEFQRYSSETMCTDVRQRTHYIGPSFETMACTAINAATVEYVPQPDKCAYITADSIFMLDAGANYKFLLSKKILIKETARRISLEQFITVFQQI